MSHAIAIILRTLAGWVMSSSPWAIVEELVSNLGAVCVALQRVESVAPEPAQAESALATAIRAKDDAAAAVHRAATADVSDADAFAITVAAAREAVARARATAHQVSLTLSRTQALRRDAGALVDQMRSLVPDHNGPAPSV